MVKDNDSLLREVYLLDRGRASGRLGRLFERPLDRRWERQSGLREMRAYDVACRAGDWGDSVSL
jgi:hypothetical protein